MTEPSHTTGPQQHKTKREESQRSAEQERELSETRDYLQAIQEQYEAANEELQASNEEVQSANEELQSINEELETSKEELESTNEELTTVNEEMASRNAELNRLNSDLVNLQTSTKLAIVLLGRDLTIRRFSTQAEKQFNLLATDVGRPIGNVRHNLDLPDLEGFITDVITRVRESERDVQDNNGRWFSLRVRPYMTLDHKIDGAVLVLVDVTDLKRTEQQIRDERNYAQAIIRTVPHPLLVLDDKLRIETANESFYRTFQVTPQETESLLIYEVGNGQWDIPALRELLEEILPQQAFLAGFEVTHTFETIGLQTMLVNAARLESKKGTAERILLSIENITERKLAETRIAADLEAMVRLHQVGSQCALPGEDYARCLTELLAAAIALTGADKGNIQLLDGATGTLLIAAHQGFDSPFLRFFRSVRPGEAAACGTAIRLSQRVTVEDVETSKIFAGQASLEVLIAAGVRAVQSTPLVSSGGQVLGMISTHFATPRRFLERELRLLDLLARQAADYIERKLAEETLLAKEERYRTLFNLSPMAIYTIDASGVILNFNRHAAELWGREPALGDTDQRFCGSFKMFRPDGSFMPHDECPMAEVVSGKVAAVHDGEVVIEKPDGSHVTVLVNIRPLKNDRGEVTGAINCFYNITERKQAEEEVKKLMQMEKAARAEAEAANRVKDEFLAIVSHELRTPLNAIVGWTHLLKTGKLDQGESERAIQTIHRNATAQTAIISELLDVSRIISGKLKLDMKPIDLADVISEAVEVVRAAADAKRIGIVTSLDRNAGLVAGEFVRLQQVMWNLLTNAIKFTPNDGRVEVHTRSVGTDCAIVISDTGAGIAADFLPYIFERFQQEDSSEKRTHGGLGLGLSIVRNLVEMHGGSISAESEGAGRGAKFTVTIPVLAVSGATSALASQEGNHQFSVSEKEPYEGDSEGQHMDLEPDILKGVRVLAVDDQRDTRDLILIALTRYGAEVRACQSAIEAYKMIEKWKPEVIVSDIGMPEEDGYDLIRKIRALTPETGGQIPAVALTGYAGAVDASKAYVAGYQVHMTKPVSLRELAATVAKLAGRKEHTARTVVSKSIP